MQCARSAICKALLLSLAMAFAGCGVARPSDFGAVCPSYEQTIRPLLENACSQCHAPNSAAGGYVIGEYTQTVSRADDGAGRVIPAEPSSPLLAAARGTLGTHRPVDAAPMAALQDWVVRCRAAPGHQSLHPKGWSTPTDAEQFHGVALRAGFYNFGQCTSCHGDDLRGGTSQVDCNSCHVEGPLACNTCHGDGDSAAPPRDLNGVRATTSLGVGAHRTHVVATATHQAFPCASCHLDVKTATQEGHYRREGVFSLGPAQVRLASGPAGAASWNRTTATCTNSTCHVPSSADTSPTRVTPVWTRVGQGDMTCGSCHGAPPSSHASAQCEACHGLGYADGGVEVALHVNGRVDLKNGGQRCDACHSGPTSPAFIDLSGGTASTSPSASAHEVHLKASRLRGPMTCNECHVVPQTVMSLGHLDSARPADVFAVDTGGLAWRQSAMPTYNAANATCTNYCHGGGDFGHPDSAGTLRTPSWGGSSSQAACGTCHGLPPVDGTLAHVSASSISCDTCHGGSVWPDGGIRFTVLPDGGVTSKHLDGLITGP